MDSLEQKIKAFYKQRKTEDERGAPDFNTFSLNNKEPGTVQRKRIFYPMAASIAAIVVVLTSYYFFQRRREGIQVNLHQRFPTEVLAKYPEQEFVWKWRSSTDYLLIDSFQTVNRIN